MSAEQEEALMGGKMKLISRRHDLVRGSGVAIFEADTRVRFHDTTSLLPDSSDLRYTETVFTVRADTPRGAFA